MADENEKVARFRARDRIVSESEVSIGVSREVGSVVLELRSADNEDDRVRVGLRPERAVEIGVALQSLGSMSEPDV